MLTPDGGRELPAGGIFGKTRFDENSPLCGATVLRGDELSAAFFVLFVLLRMVTLLDSDTARLWPDVAVILGSVCISDKIDLFDGTLRMLTKGTAAFSWAEVTEGFLVTNI